MFADGHEQIEPRSSGQDDIDDDRMGFDLGVGGALAAPSTAYIYDWNLLPIGQMLWMKELMSYKQFPALQAPSSYNLDQVIQEMQESKTTSHAGE